MAKAERYVNNLLKFSCGSCNTILSSEDLLAEVIYQDITYKRTKYEDYYVSKCGKVLSLKGKTPKVLKAFTSSNPSKSVIVALCDNGVYRNKTIKALVNEMWVY